MALAYKFVHIGVPTKVKQPNENYLADMGVYVTDPDAHEYGYEYLRFDDDSWFPEGLKTNVHIAVQVDSIAKELEKCTTLIEPIEVDEHLTIAFAERDGVYCEFMEMK